MKDHMPLMAGKVLEDNEDDEDDYEDDDLDETSPRTQGHGANLATRGSTEEIQHS